MQRDRNRIGGYGDVRATVDAAIEAGVVGANLEDDMCPIEQMQERIGEAIAAGQARGVPIVLNARTDVFLNHPDWAEDARLAEIVNRGRAYLDAGADCIFVPGCIDPRTIRALVAAFGRGRMSLLAIPGIADPSTLQTLGVARLSHGPFPHRRAMDALAAYESARQANRQPSTETPL